MTTLYEGAFAKLNLTLDILPALYQRGVVGLALTELWLGVCCILICFMANKLYKKL